MPLTTIIVVASLAIANPIETHVLDNWVRLILAPVEGEAAVAMESFYDVGFLDDPKGVPQGAHLLEHLMCFGAGEQYAEGETWAWLTEVGLVNAETLATFTRYDLLAPATDLSRLLDAEADRLRSLRITRELIEREGPRAASEAVHVARSPGAPVTKFAFMTAAQAWNHGVREVHVGAGLDRAPIEPLDALRTARGGTRSLTVVLVGGFDSEAALAHARNSLGAVPETPEPSARSIDWDALPEITRIEWDLPVAAVIVHAPPPADPVDRLLLSILSESVWARLHNDERINRVSTSMMLASTLWPVGDLPYFAAATVKPDATPDAVAEALRSRLRDAAKRPIRADVVVMARRHIADLFKPSAPEAAELDAVTRSLVQARGMTEPQARAMALLHRALQIGMQDRAARALPDRPPPPESITAERLHALLRDATDPARLKATFIVPAETPE